MAKYIHIVTVIAKAPANCYPRQKTYRAACLSEKLSYKGKAIERVHQIIKTALTNNNKDIPFELHVSAVTTQVSMLISDEGEKNLEDI
jgi:hypothetical protein